MINVLFVCLGNICRSPMAEAVFQQLVNEEGLSQQIKVDSVGTGDWHVGDPAHPGTRQILQKYGIPYNGRSRQIRSHDMANPDSYIIGMDMSNINNVQRLFGNHPNMHRLLDFAEETAVRDVPDPYYHDNFDYVYELVTDGCRGLFKLICLREGL
ncbi:MAG: low molecular weight protein-tyrosine-phosphatase [Chloroflexota bacterium]